ncbi:hypothetical protein DFH27DRAFT_539323 [Peziza echinospora]|nr:hypothetical protein DFH27DRAFT_539323 [Peziza echinospora]
MARISGRVFAIVVGTQLLILLCVRLSGFWGGWDAYEGRESVSFIPPPAAVPTSAPPADPPRLHFLVPGHQANFALCQGLRTHLINGFAPVLVNFGADAGSDRGNKYLKLAGVSDYLRSAAVRPGDIVAVVDGFDLWSQLPAHVLVERFVASGKRIVLGTDRQCFPNDPDGPVCNDIPQSPWPTDIYGAKTDTDGIGYARDHTRPRWVNSGILIGYAADVTALYASMISFREEHPEQDSGDSDQRVFAIMFWQRTFPITLDYDADFGISVAFATHDIQFMTDPAYAPAAGIEPWTREHGEVIPRTAVVRNMITDKVPVFIHFPGIAKPLMRNWNTRLWWSMGVENATEILTDDTLTRELTVAATGEKLPYHTVRLLCSLVHLPNSR